MLSRYPNMRASVLPLDFISNISLYRMYYKASKMIKWIYLPNQSVV